jgi:hypothetical protein
MELFVHLPLPVAAVISRVSVVAILIGIVEKTEVTRVTQMVRGRMARQKLERVTPRLRGVTQAQRQGRCQMTVAAVASTMAMVTVTGMTMLA